MKDWPLPLDPADRRGPGGIVLVGLGSGAATGPGSLPPLAGVALQLAGLLERPVLELDTETGPDAALAALAEQAQTTGGGWLAGLTLDVGLPLDDGRCWAEALGAWRQPVVLVIPADQLTSGVPAAATALLRHWQVPLLGLLQWGGAWQAGTRRLDALPWLGLLPDDDRDDPGEDTHHGRAVAAALALRWRQLDQP
jgi:hypothetical protein